MAPELPALGPLLFPGVICSPLVRPPLCVTAPRLLKGTWGLRRPCVALAPASLGPQAEECGSSGSLSSRVLTAKATDRVPGTVAGLRHQVLGAKAQLHGGSDRRSALTHCPQTRRLQGAVPPRPSPRGAWR